MNTGGTVISQQGTSGGGAGARVGTAPSVILALLALLSAGCARSPDVPQASEPASVAANDTAVEHAARHMNPKYRCPMHPDVVRDAPGNCPVCGMALVKIEPEAAAATASTAQPAYYRHPHDPSRTSRVPMKDEMGMDYTPVFADAASPGVRISPEVINNLGVRTESAVKGTLPRRAETVGYVGFDERQVQQVRPRAEGWVEGLKVRSMGETVRAGQVLFTLYSPMLESAQQEYLDALKIGNRDLIDASRQRLGALGLDSGTAGRISKAGRASGRVPYVAPISGVVTELELKEGSMITPAMVAITITGIGSLWVIAEVPEAQAGWIVAGTAAEMRFPSLPGEPVTGHVEYVYPELDMETRTLRARITLDSPTVAVRPNMLASVTLIGASGPEVVSIPRSALIRSGTDERVVVALGDGRFAPRRVVAGAESGERVVIREGLAAGENVVVAGQFLLDSEANLRAGLGRLGEESPAPATTAPQGAQH
jgi:Cu(I)/Ag(I) efflux system membrane fusion protein